MPRNIALTLGFIAVLLSFSPHQASADSIELKNGQKIEANILSFSDQGVKIENAGETKIITNSDISKINGRSLDADLTVVGLQNKTPDKKESPLVNLFTKSDTQSLNSKNTSLTAKIKKTIETAYKSKAPSNPKLPNNKNLPDWFWPVVISLLVALYLYFVLPYCMMAERLGLSSGWQFLTIIPILQLLAMLKIANKPLWWFIFLLIPVVNIIFMVLMYCGMAERCGKDKLIGILILVPVINVFLPWYLALGIKTIEPPTPIIASGRPKIEKRYAITPFEDESQKP